MGIFSDFFDSKPDYVKAIVKKIEGYSVDINPDIKRLLESDAIYYAENPKNWKGIEDGFNSGNKDAEYYSLYFLYLAAKDALKSGKYHIYAGVVSIEGNLVCSIGCDCLTRLLQRGFIKEDAAKDAQIHLQSLQSDVGIG
jgi:hypothetical protein